MKTITLTFNPAYDIHCYTDILLLHHENKINSFTKDVGGKGINISRALTKSQAESLAVVVLGRENSNEFESSLVGENIPYIPFYTEGRIRENITIHEASGKETRISFAGFKVDNGILSEIEKKLFELTDENTTITMTGSLPNGIDKAELIDMLVGLKQKGARIVIDSRSFSLDDIIAVKPFLIKPNEEEIALYVGGKIDSSEDAVAKAEALRNKGIENVLITLGGRGAVLASVDGCYISKAPEVEVRSTIGAGDSAIAGAILSQNSEELLTFALAYGSAACLEEGTNPPSLENINRLIDEIRTKKYISRAK